MRGIPHVERGIVLDLGEVAGGEPVSAIFGRRGTALGISRAARDSPIRLHDTEAHGLVVDRKGYVLRHLDLYGVVIIYADQLFELVED